MKKLYIWISNVLVLSLKEFKSLLSDVVFVALIIYFFTVAVVVASKGASQEIRNAPAAVVDHDQTEVTRRITGAVMPPYFKIPDRITSDEVQQHMDLGHYYFIIDFPPDYQEKLLKGENPKIQLLVDATAMTLAGTGTGYLTAIINAETAKFIREINPNAPDVPVSAESAVNVLFNPNSSAIWQMSVVQIVGNLTMLALMLSGAAVIREKERGTIEHLLVMPVSASEIAVSKIFANGSVIVVMALISLWLVVNRLMDVPVVGSIYLLSAGMFIYVLNFASLGILLAVLAPSMPQFGLLCIPVYMLVYLLSGGTSPVESMPEYMQHLIQISPTTHMMAFAQDVVHRGSTLNEVYPHLLVLLGQGIFFILIAIARFKSMLSKQ